MAIHYHEGLPGAGKSYEACVMHILPALKAGRQVITNIRGINHQKFAELTGEPLELIELLLLYVEPAEQDDETEAVQKCINEFADKTPDNSLIVWDEIQDYFPSGNYKLPLNQQKFWTEHRHRGLDIVIMGQDRDDTHKIIRNRIEVVVYFLKLTVVGRENKYKWEFYARQKKGKFEKTGSGVREYEEKYFGLYESHRRKSVKAGVYTTQRSSVLRNSKALSFGLPLVLVGAIWGVWHLWGFFHAAPGSTQVASSAQKVKVAKQETSHAPETVAQAVSKPDPELVNPPPPVDPVVAGRIQDQTVSTNKDAPVDYLDKLAQQYQIRASAIMDTKKPGMELMGYVELLDSSYHVKEKFTVQELQALGWKVTRTGYGLLIEKESSAYVVRPWPIDVYGRVDQRTVDSLGRSQGASAPTETQRSQSFNTPTIVADSSRTTRQ